MVQFHNLTVTDVQKTIRDAVIVTLQPENKDAFSFTQGQYLTFRREFDGREIRRSYSICSGRDEGILQVGIKKVEGGVFSSWANADLQVGEVLEAMPPMGKFYGGATLKKPHYLAFAGGSGITPVLSILKSGFATEPEAQFTLVYANRNPNTIMFREELEDLKNQYMGRFRILHVLEDDSQDIDLLSGRIDGEKCAQLFSRWIDIDTVNTAYICGPEPMMLAIADALEKHGLDKQSIRFELFASDQPGRAPKPAASSKVSEQGVSGRVTLNGETRSFVVPADTSLLDAGLQNHLDAPFACKSGICSTCKAKVLKGEVEMAVNHALEDYEVEAGYVLTCQCFPLSEEVVWDYDQAGH